ATPTPFWDDCLARALPDPVDQAAMEETLGYCVFVGYKGQVFFIWHGDGGTGKGLFRRVYEEILGKSRVMGSTIDSIGGDFGLAPLVGKYINIDSESEYLTPKDETTIKRMTGGDPLTINEKNKPQYKAHLPVRLILMCNDLPTFSDKSNAVWQRLVLIPFGV